MNSVFPYLLNGLSDFNKIRHECQEGSSWMRLLTISVPKTKLLLFILTKNGVLLHRMNTNNHTNKYMN
jgi:hypothetical protein